MTNKKWKVIALIFLVFLFVYSILWVFINGISTEKKHSIIKGKYTMLDFGKTRTFCIGRYLIDLPDSFYLTTGIDSLKEDHWVANISWGDGGYKAYISTKRMYYPAFERLMKDREMELNEMKTVDPSNMPFLKATRPLPTGMKGVIFERNRDVSTNDAGREFEVYMYSNGVAIKIKKETIDYSSPRYKDEQTALGRVVNDVPEDLEKINKLLLSISGRVDDDILSEPGTCIVNAFIREDNRVPMKETASFILRSKELSGFNFIVRTNNFLQENKSLLERKGGIRKSLDGTAAEIIKSYKNKLNNLKSENIIIFDHGYDGGNPTYLFELYINEKSGSNKHPWLNLTFTNEGDNNASLSGFNDDELIFIWENLTKTIRYRLKQ